MKKTLKGFIGGGDPLLLKIITVAWVAALAGVIIMQVLPQGQLSDSSSLFAVDKVFRVLVFAFLAFCPTAFFPSMGIGLILGASMAPFGFLMEYVQRSLPCRNFSPEDMIANNVGALLGIAAGLAIRFFFQTGMKPPEDREDAVPDEEQ